MITVNDVVTQLRQRFPETLASEGDPVGLQIGSLMAPVTKVMTTLDLRPNVVDEAIKLGVDLIISHHPVMFRPASNLDFANPQNAMYGQIIAHHITVYAIHTNCDKATGGSSDWQAEELGLKHVTPFVRDTDGIAIGRQGELPETMSALEFAYYVKQQMHIKMARLITADNDQRVRRIGFICGDGGKYWQEAVKAHLDAFITGDIYYHVGHDIISQGLTVVDPGHYTEKLFKYQVFKLLETWREQEHWPITCYCSNVSTNPFQDLF